MSPQLPLQFQSHTIRYSSANFIAHEGVRAAIEAIVTLAMTRRFALVYIHGPRGSGKTHLAVYLAGALREQVPHARFVAGATGARWFAEELPSDPIRAEEVVLLDDADLFIGELAGSGTFGDLVERVRGANGLLVLFGETLPAAITKDPYIKSRIEAGVTLFIGQPREADLDRLLDSVVRQRGLNLTEAKRSFLLKRIPRTLPAVVECAERLERAGEEGALSTSFEVLAEAALGGAAAGAK